MGTDIDAVSDIIEHMDRQLRALYLKHEDGFREKRLWNHTYVKHQIDRRRNHKDFKIQYHIRAMVYSMLSSGITWDDTKKAVSLNLGHVPEIDQIFCQYDPDLLQAKTPETLTDEIKRLNYAGQNTKRQMDGLIHTNLKKMVLLEQRYGTIDSYYHLRIRQDPSMKLLIRALSHKDSPDKYIQMGEVLTAEYLRNIGYDLARPDQHIRQILGSYHLGCSEHFTAAIYETLDLIRNIAENMNKSAAEVHYILWSYCAKGYGEICTSKSPKCCMCAAKKICKNKKYVS